MLQPVRKFSEKRLFTVNPIKIPLLGYFCMQNSFLPRKWNQSLRFLRNMQKIEKKNICYHYFVFFVIFSISFKQNFLKPNESCLLDRKKPNIAKLVYINFLAVSMKIAMLQPVRKFSEKRLFFVNPIKIPLLGQFLNAEFISALKTEPKPMVFEEICRKQKTNICYHYFLFFVIFSISFKQNFLKPNESCLLDRKKQNIAKLVYVNFLAVSKKIAMLQPARKFSEKRLFSVNPIKIPLLGYFCMQNSFLP